MENKIDLILLKLNDLDSKTDVTNNNVALLSSTIEELKNENTCLRQQVHLLEDRIDYLENQSRRNNVIFYNVEEHEKETWETTESNVRQIIHKEYGMQIHDTEVERAHRLGPNNNTTRPIIVKFNHFKVKDIIIKQAYKLKNTPFSVSHDFSKSVLQKRSLLKPYLIKSKELGHRAHLQYEKLAINGRKFTIEDLHSKGVTSPNDLGKLFTKVSSSSNINEIITRSKSDSKRLEQ
ncbi:hypothetical protein PPYR_06521 [Photinus pyralis]|uniref:Uncharacterized protein n=1 Tax=Photinus pyralis TaxID=7054 RepID=A0A5N4ATT2_PHOPY|nr:hypothetical protein PPYR_06521 [Photinus pyralis]